MNISLLSPIVHGNELNHWDNIDGVACSGFYNIFKKDIKFDWINVVNSKLQFDDIECLYSNINKIYNNDLVIRVGSPAWFNESDILIYEECISSNIPFGLFGIGLGCKWNIYEWHVFISKYNKLKYIFESDQCKSIICRDPNCYSFFSQFKLNNLELNGCLGYFSLDIRERVSKENVIIEILDIDTLKNNAFYSDEEIDKYYLFIYNLYSYFKINSNCKLMFQRLSFVKDDHLYNENSSICKLNIEQISDENKLYLSKYFNDEEFNLCLSYSSFSELLLNCDILITSRIHGALPAAGSGASVFGIGIDYRQFTWSLFPEIKRRDARVFDVEVEEIINWYDKLNIEDKYNKQIILREVYKNKYIECFEKLINNSKENNKTIKYLSKNQFIDKIHKELEDNIDNYDIFINVIKAFCNNNNIDFIDNFKTIKAKYKVALLMLDFEIFSLNTIYKNIDYFMNKFDYLYILPLKSKKRDIVWWDDIISKRYNTDAELCNLFTNKINNSMKRYINIFYCLIGKK